MTAYEIMVKANYKLIQEGSISENEKAVIVTELLAARSNPEQVIRFHTAINNFNLTNAGTDKMYPVFYIPPYNNGRKLKTILTQTPKTNILAANMYELEILRLLHILAPENDIVKAMIDETIKRLKTTCFGYQQCGKGECYDASLIVLRFICTAAPEDTAWIQSRIDNYYLHVNEKKRPWFASWYYWLCLSEMPSALAISEIDNYKDEMLNRLNNKSCVMNSIQDKIIHPVLLFIVRNNITRYPEYEYIKEREPFISDKDGRLYFNMKQES